MPACLQHSTIGSEFVLPFSILLSVPALFVPVWSQKFFSRLVSAPESRPCSTPDITFWSDIDYRVDANSLQQVVGLQDLLLGEEERLKEITESLQNFSYI